VHFSVKQSLVHHGLFPAAALTVILLLSACWLPTDSSDKADKQQPTIPLVVSSTESGDTTTAIVFEEPLLRADNIPATPAAQNTTSSSENKDNRPRVAIIIDDMGYHHNIGNHLLALELNLSFSFLPDAPFVLEQEEQAYQLGRDVMVHLPMEAADARWDPGPGALFLSAPAKEQLVILKHDLAAVPHAIGANNHMGSKFTRNRPAMRRILTELKAQGLFFVDSFTTAQSIGLTEAQAMGLKTNRRHVFLDNVQDPAKICIQLDRLAALAVRQHSAIGIGHPYQATLDALRHCGKKLLKTVQIVPVHELVQ